MAQSTTRMIGCTGILSVLLLLGFGTAYADTGQLQLSGTMPSASSSVTAMPSVSPTASPYRSPLSVSAIPSASGKPGSDTSQADGSGQSTPTIAPPAATETSVPTASLNPEPASATSQNNIPAISRPKDAVRPWRAVTLALAALTLLATGWLVLLRRRRVRDNG
jgi:hypothetical protein